MERIPSDIIRTYRALSIADFLKNEDQIKQDIRGITMGWIDRLNIFFRFMEGGVGLIWTGGKWQFPAMVYVEIPSVSHYPSLDNLGKHRKLTLIDNTGQMEVDLLGGNFLARAINSEAEVIQAHIMGDTRMNLQDIETCTWVNRDATLLVSYRFLPPNDKRFLVEVRNYLPAIPSRGLVTWPHMPVPALNPQVA